MTHSKLRKLENGDATGAGARDYAPMRLTNFTTGQLQEVILKEPGQLERSLVHEPRFELRCDLARALQKFTRPQQRVIVRHLVMGQSMREATRGMKRTEVWWWKWYTKIALPSLRRDLSDYVENGKVVV